jgi:hypothetical protein
MMLRRALTAYFAWLLAHAVAGVAIALVTPRFSRADLAPFILGNGLFDGTALGLAQWLALSPFLPKLRLWAPVTIVATPLNWGLGYVFGFVTLGVFGWVAAAISALVQWPLLARSTRSTTRRGDFSSLWVPAALFGGAIFYFSWWVSNGEGRALFWGTIAYAIVTGPVIALLVARADRMQTNPNSS